MLTYGEHWIMKQHHTYLYRLISTTAHYYMRPCCVCFCSDACLNTSTLQGPRGKLGVGTDVCASSATTWHVFLFLVGFVSTLNDLVAVLDTQPPASARIALQPICPPASRSGIWGFATCYSLTLRVSP